MGINFANGRVCHLQLPNAINRETPFSLYWLKSLYSHASHLGLRLHADGASQCPYMRGNFSKAVNFCTECRNRCVPNLIKRKA